MGLVTLNALIDELFAAVTATWSEISVSNGNLISSVQATQEQLIERFNSGQGSTPRVVVNIGHTIPDPDFGSANNAQRAIVGIYYITHKGPTVSNGSQLQQGDLDAKMRALKTYIEGNNFTTFRETSFAGAIDTSESSSVNSMTLADSKTSILCGSLLYSNGLLILG